MAFSSNISPRSGRPPSFNIYLHVIDRDMDRDYQRGRVDTKIGASAEIGRNVATARRTRDAIVFIISSSLACRTLS